MLPTVSHYSGNFYRQNSGLLIRNVYYNLPNLVWPKNNAKILLYTEVLDYTLQDLSYLSIILITGKLVFDILSILMLQAHNKKKWGTNTLSVIPIFLLCSML